MILESIIITIICFFGCFVSAILLLRLIGPKGLKIIKHAVSEREGK